ncbi:hypothetical protein C7S17_0784 [Burkholderia thailandensis]|nr:hypothetical protein [Burkholderia thailandensis]
MDGPVSAWFGRLRAVVTSRRYDRHALCASVLISTWASRHFTSRHCNSSIAVRFFDLGT